MTKKYIPTIEELQLISDHIKYDSDTGKLFRIKNNKLINTVTQQGYITVSIGNDRYLGHCVAWFLHYGYYSEKLIDHANRIKTDNRISNLREATFSENMLNKIYKNGGVNYDNNRKTWVVRQRLYIGAFSSKDEALLKANEFKIIYEKSQLYKNIVNLQTQLEKPYFCKIPSREELALIKTSLSYNGETGEIYNRRGKRIGWKEKQGYVVIEINNQQYKVHRVAWLLHYGEWPSKLLDHINGQRDDNRIKNLRLVTHVQNSNNHSARDMKKIYWHKTKNKWIAELHIFFSTFPTKEEAKKCKKDIQNLIYGENNEFLCFDEKENAE